jgi:hypothetical protein
MTQATWPESAVDLARWPIDDLEGEGGRRLLADVRAEVARLGACTLDGFLRLAATRRLAQKVAEVADGAHHHEGRSTPYLELPGDDWPSGHPRVRWDAYSLAALAYDRIPEALGDLYRWPPLLEWVRRALSLAEIHPYADPLGACNVAPPHQHSTTPLHRAPMRADDA